jgi:APA family basic amino acid/polyamine antiporter
LKEAYGNVFGFLYGWVNLLVITSGAIAALSLAFAKYSNYLIHFGEKNEQMVAVLAIVLITGINIFRVKAGEIFSSIFTGLKLIGIAGIVVVGLIWGKAEGVAMNSSWDPSSGSIWTAMGLGLIGVLWSFGGWQHASFLAAEVKDGRKNVPRAMIAGAFIVTLVYVLINLAYLTLLPVETISRSSSLAADAIETVIPLGGNLVAVIIAISVIGTAGIYTLSSPRIYFAMAADGHFFRKLAHVHPRFQTPVYAITVQSAWAVFLILFWGTFEDVITYCVFTDWVFFGMAAGAIFLFRKTRKTVNRPYRTWGYPVTPLIFVGITCFFIVNTLIEKPLHALAGLILIALGTIFYFIFRRISSRGTPP